MTHTQLRGTGVALVTPFTPDDAVDYDALHTLINHQINGGADFLCILATTGETPCLSSEERQKVQQHVLSQVRERVPIVLGYGGNNTAELVRGLTFADLQGISALLSVCPYYNKPSQQGLYRHFRALADASPLPIILYNVPGRTGVNLQAHTTLQLANDAPNIIAIKEASGDMEQISTILRERPDGFHVLSGDDSLTLPMIRQGAEGVISVIANALPNTFSRMVRHALQGDYDQAEHLDRQLQPLYDLLTRDGNPAGIKALLAHMHLAHNIVRLPLVRVSDNTNDLLRIHLHGLGRTA